MPPVQDGQRSSGRGIRPGKAPRPGGHGGPGRPARARRPGWHDGTCRTIRTSTSIWPGLVLRTHIANKRDVLAADCSVPVIRAVIEADLGAAFQPGPGPDHASCLITGTTKVFFHASHPFDDDTDFPVSRYACPDQRPRRGRNHERQLAAARRIFVAAQAQNCPAMLSHGTQGHLAIYP